MTNYKIDVREAATDVVEVYTNQIIKTFENKSDARKLMRHLNLGGGFDGFSPSFFLKVANIKLKKV